MIKKNYVTPLTISMINVIDDVTDIKVHTVFEFHLYVYFVNWVLVQDILENYMKSGKQSSLQNMATFPLSLKYNFLVHKWFT